MNLKLGLPEMIYYYTELLGMRDTITEEDLLIDVSKTEIEKQLVRAEKDKQLMEERMKSIEEQLKRMLEVTSRIEKAA